MDMFSPQNQRGVHFARLTCLSRIAVKHLTTRYLIKRMIGAIDACTVYSYSTTYHSEAVTTAAAACLVGYLRKRRISHPGVTSQDGSHPHFPQFAFYAH